jgi:hypothetical protein
MCNFNPKNDSRFIDPCLVEIIKFLKENGIETISSCCGHGKYPITIIVKTNEIGITQEIFSGIIFKDRKKKYYKKDKEGIYFIPEITHNKY